MIDKVLCFGEILLRLSPDMHGDWLTKNAMSVYAGGAELNVATALAKWNVPVSYCTAMPDNFLSKQMIHHVKQKNIDTSSIQFTGERIGLYYLEQGAEIKHANIIYDRANSSFANLKNGMIDWEKVLKDVRWFHFSAISPALSASAAEVCEEALQACVSKGITISVDLNYRVKLWQYGKKPHEIMPQLAAHCDVIMGNIWAAETMLSISIDGDVIKENSKEIYLQQSMFSSEKIIQQFPKCKAVANTFRFEKSNLVYYTTLFTSNKLLVSAEYKTEKVNDKVGSGDCFMAGLIYGLYNKLDEQETLDFATAAAFQKLFIEGDSTNKSAEEVRVFIQKS